MKKITKSILIGALCLFSLNQTTAQGLLKKLLTPSNQSSGSSSKKITPIEAEPYPSSFSDDIGISDTYFCLDTIWIKENGQNCPGKRNECKLKVNDKQQPYFVTKLKLKYLEGEEGNSLGNLSFYFSEFQPNWSEKSGNLSHLKKAKVDHKINQFFFYDMHYRNNYELVEVEPGVLIHCWYAAGNSVRNIEIINVYAKDKAKLEVYDKETALAKIESVLKKIYGSGTSSSSPSSQPTKTKGK